MTALSNLLENAIALLALSAIPALLVGRVQRPGALSFLKVHAAVFTALVGLALIVFPLRSAADPWWPHPIQVTFWFVAFLAWAMELLALRAIIYVARLRTRHSLPRQHPPE
ncbi:hypothetical protein [Roseomonas fluvialis]|uniref:Uncharacterized protein n=1 Tax=Roseomonas fluvialis TaxID=1750527 RepID=A0ABM7Y326_9PROT|nr:hypothetical protein [Roseomonas fluvialis]BDG72223.1 hypothetical protein Rmf_21520 [Roseomonas fluvialis]